MKKMKIVNINGYEYELKNENNSYKIGLEFYDLDEKIGINDHIFMSEKLLDKNYEEYDTFYRFGKLNGEYGRKLTTENTVDVIGLQIKEKIIYLQRYYG